MDMFHDQLLCSVMQKNFENSDLHSFLKVM